MEQRTRITTEIYGNVICIVIRQFALWTSLGIPFYPQFSNNSLYWTKNRMSEAVQSKEDGKARPFKIIGTFKYAECRDYVYMIVGALTACVTGASIPFFNVLFGKIIDRLNGDANSFQKGVNEVALVFAIMAGIDFFTGFLQVTL
jgi:hypothetical protein